MSRLPNIWDRMSRIYDTATNKFSELNTRIVANTTRFLRDNDIVLECGCGTGTMTIGIADYVREICAIDISSGMLAIARLKANKNEASNVTFLQSTLFDERFRMGSFDVVLAYNVLHYLEDIERNIRRINYLLKSKGKFISVTPCSIEKRTLTRRLFSGFISSIVRIGLLPHIAFFRYSELGDLVVEGGFRIIETEKMGGPEEHYFVVAEKI